MSTHHFRFNIECPQCKNIIENADGFDTDDWVEVFPFSGYSPKSVDSGYNPYYICPNCGMKIDRDSLYRNKYIKMIDDFNEVKDYLEYLLDDVIKEGYIYDHGWSPDFEAVVNRYASLFPADREMMQIRRNYIDALHNRRVFTKFEPTSITTSINADMIRRKTCLEKVYLPQGLKSIEPDTFKGCMRLRDIFVPDSVEEIGSGAFEESGIETVHLPKILYSISDFLFKNCWKLDKVFLSDEITVIGESSFEGCSRLKKPWLPAKLIEIRPRAFYGCKTIKDIYIPDSVKVIGEDAFGNCPEFVIKGHQGSVAEKYAKENSIAFVAD